MPAQPTRRHFLTLSASAALAGVAVAQNKALPNTETKPPLPGEPPKGPYKLEPLPYDFNALEPTIDAKTMEIHHDKHHQAYVNGLNTALKSSPGLASKPLAELIGGIPFLPEAIQTPVRNHGGGHWNHSFFWDSMGPAGSAGVGSDPADADLMAALTKAFGGIPEMKRAFGDAAGKRFGSGWAWLILKADGTPAIVSTPNQDNPLMQGIVPNTDRGTPLLGLDVWEHAYYLHYQNRRADYANLWWNVVNWPAVTKRYQDALAGLKK